MPDDYSEGGTFSDNFANHDEWHVDADGNYTSSWTSSGGGEGTYYLNVVTGANYINVTGRDADGYSAHGGVNADGASHHSTFGEVHGDADFTLHVEDDLGNALDGSGTDYYQAQSDDGLPVTGNYGGTATYAITRADGSTDSGDDSYSYPIGYSYPDGGDGYASGPDGIRSAAVGDVPEDDLIPSGPLTVGSFPRHFPPSKIPPSAVSVLEKIRPIAERTQIWEFWGNGCERWVFAFEENLDGFSHPDVKERYPGWERSYAIGGGHATYDFHLIDGTIIRVDHWIYYGGTRYRVILPASRRSGSR